MTALRRTAWATETLGRRVEENARGLSSTTRVCDDCLITEATAEEARARREEAEARALSRARAAAKARRVADIDALVRLSKPTTSSASRRTAQQQMEAEAMNGSSSLARSLRARSSSNPEMANPGERQFRAAAEKERRRQELALTRTAEVMAECTFTPAINRRPMEQGATQRRPIDRRCEEWAKARDAKVEQLRGDLREHELDGCTFTPSLTIHQERPQESQPDEATVKQHMERIQRARDMKELAKLAEVDVDDYHVKRYTGKQTVFREFHLTNGGMKTAQLQSSDEERDKQPLRATATDPERTAQQRSNVTVIADGAGDDAGDGPLCSVGTS